jgi:hypothetical protein
MMPGKLNRLLVGPSPNLRRGAMATALGGHAFPNMPTQSCGQGTRQIQGLLRRTALLLAGGVGMLLAGCHEGAVCPDQCADIPCGAIPRPAGVYNCQWETAQIARAAQDKFVIHLNEWYQGGTTLGPDGRRHLAWLATQLQQGASSVILATDEDEALNAPRRKAVIDGLTLLGIPDAGTRVALGYSEAEGLYGPDAVRAGNARLGVGNAGGQGNNAGGYGGTGGGGVGFGTGTAIGGVGGGMGLY